MYSLQVPMRWALVGAGLWATKVHASCLSDNPNVSFVGVWARDLTRSSMLAEQFGVQSESSGLLSSRVDDDDAIGLSLASEKKSEKSLDNRFMRSKLIS
jgi:predicted dehydrogenase